MTGRRALRLPASSPRTFWSKSTASRTSRSDHCLSRLRIRVGGRWAGAGEPAQQLGGMLGAFWRAERIYIGSRSSELHSSARGRYMAIAARAGEQIEYWDRVFPDRAVPRARKRLLRTAGAARPHGAREN